ncbi:MAG: glycoside hydrolase family 9 protein [Ferruginibacter sp.]
MRLCFPGILKLVKRRYLLISFLPFLFLSFAGPDPNEPVAWIRINQLGYSPGGIKVAVWCGKGDTQISSFRLIDAVTQQIAFTQSPSKNFGSYGPFENTYRLNFSSFEKPGKYYLEAGNAISPVFNINTNVYDGSANFCLQYMRQQRSSFNPFLKDSCHNYDGYTMYGPMPDSTHVDVSGGWHDASDYLQYSATSANATWHLLAAYRDFSPVFRDEKQANGLDGKNEISDVLDEANWGLEWLLKMHPRQDWMFNQLADDRDHQGMRIPKQDSFYGKGFERPVYFITGEPQGLFKYKNRTTGTSSTAAKFASAFALAQYLHATDTVFRRNDKKGVYFDKALSAYRYALKKPGVTQTAPGRAPYFYEEDNWTDDMELAAASIQDMMNVDTGGYKKDYSTIAYGYAQREKITPWLGADTAKHYQWYPFINLGHYELAKQLKNNSGKRSAKRDAINSYYRQGIERVWARAKENAFYRGVPFIWCSNNLTVSFAIQCYWYKQLTGDKIFSELEQANVDWLFGCNPWGTSMVYGLPSGGDSPADPHSAFTHLKQYPINGGLVDGPVYTSIFKNLIGIQLQEADEYSEFQSGLAVYHDDYGDYSTNEPTMDGTAYHDDYGDYSTNEPTMDGTASLIYLLAAKETEVKTANAGKYPGAINRGNQDKKEIALVFTGDEFADGGKLIADVLKKQAIRASFFFTGNFYRNADFKPLIQRLAGQGNYLGPHSDQHLLYCDWDNRDSLLVTKSQFTADLNQNLVAIENNGVSVTGIRYFLPPYEWYNDSIAAWTKELNMQLINYSPGTLSTADYTYPGLKNYRSSDEIFESILAKEKKDGRGLNGYILLLHIGTDPKRTDKFYYRLNELVTVLKQKGYLFKKVNELLR